MPRALLPYWIAGVFFSVLAGLGADNFSEGEHFLQARYAAVPQCRLWRDNPFVVINCSQYHAALPSASLRLTLPSQQGGHLGPAGRPVCVPQPPLCNPKTGLRTHINLGGGWGSPTEFLFLLVSYLPPTPISFESSTPHPCCHRPPLFPRLPFQAEDLPSLSIMSSPTWLSHSACKMMHNIINSKIENSSR